MFYHYVVYMQMQLIIALPGGRAPYCLKTSDIENMSPNVIKKHIFRSWETLTGKGVDAGTVTAATWQWYGAMEAILQGQHAINPPLVVASATAGGLVNTLASTPSTAEEEAGERTRNRKRKRESDLFDF